MYEKGIRVMQRWWAPQIQQARERYQEELENRTVCQQPSTHEQLAKLRSGHAAKYLMGTTLSGQRVVMSASKALNHFLSCGASGSGKSYSALSLALQILQQPRSSFSPAFTVIDPKPELFGLVLQYLNAYRFRLPPAQREAFRRRVRPFSFSSTGNGDISPYNILARQPGLSDEMLVADRLEIIGDQMGNLAPLTVRMQQMLKYFLLLMVEADLPLPLFEKLCFHPRIRSLLVDRSRNPMTKEYFHLRFPKEGQGTIMALVQRIDALLVSPGVRLSLSAPTAPDFAREHDEGICRPMCMGGSDVSYGATEVLQGTVLSDLKRGVFRRKNPRRPHLLLIDEAQRCFKKAVQRENIVDLLTQSRSFGTYLGLLTQSLSSAVRDPDIINVIQTNIRWLQVLRSTARDASLLATAIPLTGTCPKPSQNPFDPPKFLTESEETKMRLEEVSTFQDREGYFWSKAELPQAIKMITPHVPAPHEIAGCTPDELARFSEEEPWGGGMSAQAIQRSLDEKLSALESNQIRLQPISRAQTGAPPRRSLETILEEQY